MNVKIEKNFEFSEIINTFPFLKENLENYEINTNEIEDNITIEEFLKKNKKYSDIEIEIFLKKLNFDLKYYYKYDKMPPKKTSKKQGKLLILKEEKN
jgi:hypothetical protein